MGFLPVLSLSKEPSTELLETQTNHRFYMSFSVPFFPSFILVFFDVSLICLKV